jgi:uncharacterized iron-regulated membrane protein
MSVTGVLLTYERQIVSLVENSYLGASTADDEALSADVLFAIAQQAEPNAEQITLTYSSDPDSVMRVSAGRNRNLLIDPYRGEILHDGETAIEKFFTTTMYIHRWFALSGESRAVGRAITGYSNLLFLFLLCSGIYLWLPRVWNRVMVKTRILFNPKAKSGKARDFNWHHVFAFWSVIPLFFLITTASVFYFPWANNMVYRAFGEDPPERGENADSLGPLPDASSLMTRAELLQLAIKEFEERGVADWKSVAMQVSTTPDTSTSFRADRSIGGQPAMVYNLQLDSVDGSVANWSTFADKSPGTRTRNNIRFLHTGEVFGTLGQTIAGLASLAACLMVWTGLALAWRRLLQPLFLRKFSRRQAT